MKLTKKYLFACAIATLFLQLHPLTGYAQTLFDQKQTFVFQWENDAFAKADENYTNGLKIAWISPDKTTETSRPEDTGWPASFIRRLPFGNRADSTFNAGIAMGQNIYTPDDTKAAEIVEDERPYAGMTYLSLALHAKTPDRLNTFELTLAAIGPSSFAEQSQSAFHDLLDADSPEGWNNQLNDEPGLSLAWQHHWHALASNRTGTGFGLDLTPHFGAAMGNIAVCANAGASVRIGYGLPSDFGVSPIGWASANGIRNHAADSGSQRPDQSGIYFFARADARLVARDIFLDGNTWQDSHSVRKKAIVGDLSAGLSMRYKDAQLTYLHVYRSREYEEKGGGDFFGSVMLTIMY